MSPSAAIVGGGTAGCVVAARRNMLIDYIGGNFLSFFLKLANWLAELRVMIGEVQL